MELAFKMQNFIGKGGFLYFPEGWHGRPWDNYYKIENIKNENEQITLEGSDWKLSGEILTETVISNFDYMILNFKRFNFTSLGKKSFGSNGGFVLFWSGSSIGEPRKLAESLIHKINIENSF